jgi:hypothetical protein
LVSPCDAYLNRLREGAEGPQFEIWNRGFDHCLNSENEDGETYSEFHNTPLSHQKYHLGETQRLAKDCLDLKLTTFSALG